MNMILRNSVALLFLCISTHTFAGATRDGEGDQALKRMQYMLKQLNEEKSRLEIEFSELEKEKKDLDKDYKKAKEQIIDMELTIQKNEANIASLEGTVEKRDAKIERREKQLRDVIGKYQDAQLLIRQLNGQIADMNQDIESKNASIEEFDEKNLKLFEANQELMDLYQNKSTLDALLQKDGITGLKEVKIENILQEYRLKLENNRITEEEKQTSLEVTPQEF